MVFVHYKLQGFLLFGTDLGQITRGMQALHKMLSISWSILKTTMPTFVLIFFSFSGVQWEYMFLFVIRRQNFLSDAGNKVPIILFNFTFKDALDGENILH